MIKSLTKDERYTPSKYIISVKIVLEHIDLDPASCIEANNRIKADKIYTKEDSGLDKQWFGNVYLNPPYSRGNLELWCAKIRFEFEQKNINNGILLIPNATDTDWFKLINDRPFCATDHRISFLEYNSNNKKFYYLKNPENGSIFALFSENPLIYNKFLEEFSKYGPIFRRII